jgi:hypothetical protein
MKTIILAFAVLSVTTAAFADSNGTTRRGDKCWAATDARGFGFWDKCAEGQMLVDRNKQEGLRRDMNQPRTQSNIGTAGPGGGGGGGE